MFMSDNIPGKKLYTNEEPKTNPPTSRAFERKGTKKVFKSFAELKEYQNGKSR